MCIIKYNNVTSNNYINYQVIKYIKDTLIIIRGQEEREIQGQVLQLEEDFPCSLIPKSGIGSNASQPYGTHSPTMLMEIGTQPQSHKT